LVPGPGHYPSRTLIGQKGTVGGAIGIRYKVKHEQPGASNVPGPGAYKIDISPVKMKDPTWRIGTSRRDDTDRAMRRTSNFPPPNSYNPNFGTTRNSEPKWGFGSSKRS